ncbi:MAG: class A sortase [Lacticaseibacillus songhuajiangensis]|jgi:sortase A|nr:class A sortase [Lacticaseibacillus songhuajiangensis]
MMRFLRWFWPPLLFVGVLAGLVWAGNTALTTDVPLNTPAWRQAAAVNQNKRVGQKVAIRDVNTTVLAQAQADAPNQQHRYGMGELTIPRVNIDLAIYAVVTNSTLATGVARYFPDRSMGQGNNVYAAHNMFGANILLGGISRLHKGDTITQTDFKHVYAYHVVYNRVVRMTETAVLNQTSERRITLIRCEGPRRSKFRHVVIGRLSKVAAYKPQRQDTQRLLRTAQQMTGTVVAPRVHRPLIAALLFAFILLLGWSWHGYYNDHR